jgi:hypothetical protein
MGDGYGLTPSERYKVYHAGDTSNTAPVTVGQTFIMWNSGTGTYCRVASLPGGFQLKQQTGSITASSVNQPPSPRPPSPKPSPRPPAVGACCMMQV